MDKQTDVHAERRMALLIDGDNARPTLIQKFLNEAGRYGSTTIRRIYGDWTTPNMNGWKGALNNHAVQPVQQFRYTVGKNATDSAMIIDAMDILHSGLASGFCIVSSDSDYTRLATRIRESGIFVMGIGDEKTPRPFVNACNIFIYTENLLEEETSEKKKKVNKTQRKKKQPDPVAMLKEAYELAAGEDDWAHLGTMGTHLRQIDPGFDPRTFGYRQLSQLIRAHSEVFQLRQEGNGSGPTPMFVRMKGS